MKLKFIDQQGAPLEEAVSKRLHKILEAVQKSSKVMQDSMLHTVKNHFRAIYPDSKHYSPDKVTPLGTKSSGTIQEASIDIDVPGVTRAYHDMDIRPRLRKYLTIPIHRESYGKSARDFSNLIFIQKKNGTKLLAQKEPSGLMFLYVLKDHVFQRQDQRLMPTDDNLATNIFARIGAYLDRTLKN